MNFMVVITLVAVLAVSIPVSADRMAVSTDVTGSQNIGMKMVQETTVSKSNETAQEKDVKDGSEAIEETQAVEPEKELISLDDIGISIEAAGYVLIEQKNRVVYLYTQKDSEYPCIVFNTFGFEYDNILDIYISLIDDYPDLEVKFKQERYEINGDLFDKLVYHYMSDDNEIEETRLFYELGGDIYMFGSTESTDLDAMLPEGYLEDVADSFRLLSGNPDDYSLHVNEEYSVTEEGMKPVPHEEKRTPA